MKIFFAATLLFIASSLPAQVLFQDHFDQGKSTLWMQVNDGSTPGQFSVQNGQYVLTSNDPVQSLPRAIVHGIKTGDYFIEATVTIRPLNTAFAEASLLSYYSGSRAYYEFGVDGIHARWFAQKVDKSGATLIGNGPLPVLKASYRLGFFVKDREVRAFVEGRMVLRDQQPQGLRGGESGLSVRGAEAAWDDVRITASNPREFTYRISSSISDARGTIRFDRLSFLVTDAQGSPLPRVLCYRISKDERAYFVFAPAVGAIQSGFTEEFKTIGPDSRKVIIESPGVSVPRKQNYDAYQTGWILDLLQRTDGIASDRVIFLLKSNSNLYLRSGSLQLADGEPVNDTILGPDGEKTQTGGLFFELWGNAGDYSDQLKIAGNIEPSGVLLTALLSKASLPEGSKFTIHTLRLASQKFGSAPVFLNWVVQEDSRALLTPDQVQFPEEIRAGGRYPVSYHIRNLGEKSGPFEFLLFLSGDSLIGPGDIKLAQRNFAGLDAGSETVSTVDVTIPLSLPRGHYFLGTYLATSDPFTRVRNSYVRAVNSGTFPKNGSLEISLTWKEPVDLDLHITDPFQETLYYYIPQSNSGGRLAGDVRCAEAGEPETVSYPQGKASSGLYRISIHYFDSCGLEQPAHWNLKTTIDGRTQTLEGVIQPGEYLHATDIQR